MRGLIENMKEKELLRMATPLKAPVYKCSDPIPAKGRTFEWTANIEGKVLHISVICYKTIHDGSNKINDVDIIEDRLFLHIAEIYYPYNFNLNLKSPDITDFSEISHNNSVRRAYSDIYI